jgi:uncharacterized membrane protein
MPHVQRTDLVGSLFYFVTVLSMIATPLFERSGEARRWLASVVVVGLCGVGVSSVWGRFGLRASIAALAVMVTTFLVEWLGSTTGFPFGAYQYTGALQPEIVDVPMIVPVAWAGITLVTFATFGSMGFRKFTRVLLMAGAITAWDLFLDPQMVAEGYWVWEPADLVFRGIPVVNYLGWFATALLVSLLVGSICRPSHSSTQAYSASETDREIDALDAGYVRTTGDDLALLMYTTLGTLSTIGFLVFFDDVVVAIVGGVVMGGFIVIGWKVRARQRRTFIG